MKGDVQYPEGGLVVIGCLFVAAIIITLGLAIGKHCQQWRNRIEGYHQGLGFWTPELTFKDALGYWLGLTAAFALVGYGGSIVFLGSDIQWWQVLIVVLSGFLVVVYLILTTFIGDWDEQIGCLLDYISFPIYVIWRGLRLLSSGITLRQN